MMTIPDQVIGSYLGLMRALHGDQVADHIRLDYNRGFYRLSLPTVMEDGSVRRFPPRGLRLQHMINSIYRLSERYVKEKRYMVPVIACNITPLQAPDAADAKLWRCPCGELSVVSFPGGLKLVWLPLRQSSFSDAVVSYFSIADNTLNELRALVEDLSRHEGVEMYHIHLIPVGETAPRYSLDITPQNWRHFADAVKSSVQ
jgi:hypothetical protein